MSIINTIKRRLIRGIIRIFENTYYELKLELKQRQVNLGIGSVLHKESVVNNTTNDSSKIQVGNNTHIRGELLLWPYSKGIQIGDYCYLGVNSKIWSGERVKIGSNVLIAHNVSIIDSDSHELDHLERSEGFKEIIYSGHPKTNTTINTKPITIMDHVWISYNVGVLKGVTIGEGAIIAAGSIVVNDVDPFCLVAGNPAKIIKKVG